MPTEETTQQTPAAATETDAPKTPAPNDIATVTVLTKSPVKHSGTLYKIGGKIEDEFQHFEAMIESGLLRLEGFVAGKPAKK
ncbi:hypothetical protein [Acidihalobacter prosperus]|uniref:Uncharacterized protein n=1 Tax=Acidihalobacter prosperus TaxID=160660 RepID=A0A1A6C8B3_9GAMM|nr:hypothetical protein [Acidihalobacter prosperus]OBS10790.1 hypothetical protein Thpro_020506 [Acidihalobacter prosperus]